ncbi:gamma-glutamyltransferase [Steroidobacter agaridevorans]|uniref:gamma-glutamyltransferase n=1 Tax=Steroidobacter agaridevorans TaxID=2695856 RepID=UPI00192A1E47|nr:gamma-glutamyltransferase [Steroidobacter agaridevorans]
MSSVLRAWSTACLVGLLAACASPSAKPVPSATGTGWVTAANPHAVAAGIEVLRNGGSAVDAAIAVQLVLGLTEPQSSGIGGGAFLLVYDPSTRQVSAFNGREAAPAAAQSDMFMATADTPLTRAAAVVSGRATGVPGVMRLLERAHGKFGRRPWVETFEPAIHLAREGFEVSPRMARYLSGSYPQVQTADVRALFARPDGTPLQAGDQFRNPAYASTLQSLATTGADALYRGTLAQQIVARTQAAPLGGAMTEADLASYSVDEVAPLCRIVWAHQVCVPPPPSSGVGVLQLLALLERTDIEQRRPDDPRAWLLFAQASRLMYADRDRYVADPRFVEVPVSELLAPDYIEARARLIDRDVSVAPAAGEFPARRVGEDATAEAAGTSHFVIGDASGMVVSMTTTVETYFGSGRTVGGFVLNNQMTDFSLNPRDGERPAANAVAGGKRPRSSMAPIVVLDLQGRFVAALGSPGGNAIPAYNGKTLLATLAWGMDLRSAIELPNLIARGGEFVAETERFAPGVVEELARLGLQLRPPRGEESGLHGLWRQADGTMLGAADSRREGTVNSVATQP